MHRIPFTKATLSKPVIFLFLIGCLLFSGCSAGSPKEIVDTAVKNTFHAEHPLTDELGLKELVTSLSANKSHSASFDLKLQRAQIPSSGFDVGKLEGLGVSLDTVLSPSEKKLVADLGVDYGDVISLHSLIGLEKTSLSVCIPKLLENSFSLDLATLGADMNSDNVVANYLRSYAFSIPNNFTFNPWVLLEQPTASTSKPSAKKKLSAYKEDFCEQLIYKKLKKNNKYVPKGTPAKQFYSVTAPAPACKELLTGLFDVGYGDFLPSLFSRYESVCNAFGSTGLLTMNDLPDRKELQNLINMLPDICEDPVFIVGLDRKGRIVYLALELSIQEQPYHIELKIKHAENGTQRMFLTYSDQNRNSIMLDLSLGSDVQSYSFDLHGKASFGENHYTALIQYEWERATKEFSFHSSLSQGNDVLFSFETEGLLKDIQKGDHFTAVLHYFDVECKDVFSVSVSGSVGIFATPKTIVLPSGKVYRIFKLSNFDLLLLGTKMSANIKKDPVLSQLFELIPGLN